MLFYTIAVFKNTDKADAVSYSAAPRNIDDSYMPCFLVGECAAVSIASSSGARLYRTHHQTGHILAALYSCKRLDLLKSNKSFVALHVSGGTTDMLLCRPDEQSVLDITHIGGTLDLNAGQAVDRVGVAMGIDFPCGPQLEMLAAKSEKSFSVKPVIKGKSCCLSGLENMCMKMLSDGAEPSDVARFCLEYIASSIKAITLSALDEFGTMPVIFAGGVMSDKLIRNTLCEIPDSWFAEPEFSCDNAVGVALFGAVKKGLV